MGFHLIKRLGYCTVAIVWLFSTSAMADEGSQAQLLSMVSHLQKQMAAMQKTIDAQNIKIRDLENRPSGGGGRGPLESTPPMSDYEFNQRLESSLGGANKWLKDLAFKGDLRLRYEGFHFTSGSSSETDDRNRFRFRLRFGFEKKFSEDMKVGFALASGEQTTGTNVDPTSTNVTLSNDFNFKSIWIEKVYATYNPPLLRKGPVKNVNLTAGKFDNPFEKGASDMIWDRDVKPEGLYEKVDVGIRDGENFDLSTYFTSGQFVLQESATVGKDAELFAFQWGLESAVYVPMLERPVQLLNAVSWYDYIDYTRNSNFLIGATSLARGNTNADGDVTRLDVDAFQVWESYNELAITPFGLPIRPFVDVAHNGRAREAFAGNSWAWSIGTKLGAIVKRGDWEISHAFKSIEPESVVGAFNDSDFGNGHAGKIGNVFKAGYALTDTMTVNSALFLVQNLTANTDGVRNEEQRRLQVDMVWKF